MGVYGKTFRGCRVYTDSLKVLTTTLCYPYTIARFISILRSSSNLPSSAAARIADVRRVPHQSFVSQLLLPSLRLNAYRLG